MAKKKYGSYECGRSETGDPEAERPPILVVLKVQMHCGSCVEKIRSCVLDFPGVEMVKMEADLNRVIVVGRVNPFVIRENLQRKIGTEVELVSPRPEKGRKPDGHGKFKEPPLRTVVLKIKFHCEGCVEKIRRTVTKIRGVYRVSIDKEKEQVTLQGTMDVEEVKGRLTEKLKRSVEVVALKKLVEDRCEGNPRECQRHSLHPGYWWVPVYVQCKSGCGCNAWRPVMLDVPPPALPSSPYLGLFSDENANSCSVL